MSVFKITYLENMSTYNLILLQIFQFVLLQSKNIEPVAQQWLGGSSGDIREVLNFYKDCIVALMLNFQIHSNLHQNTNPKNCFHHYRIYAQLLNRPQTP